MGNDTNKSRSDPLSTDEITTALLSSGFPLEIRLLKVFKEGGMEPRVGFRVPREDGKTHEVDILASFHRSSSLGGNNIMTLTLLLLVEAKGFGPCADFVGMRWEHPTEQEMRWQRAYFGGFPSSRVVSGWTADSTVLIGEDGVCVAFDQLNDAPHCVQWANVRRKGAGKDQHSIAEHDDRFWDGLDGIVRGSHALMKDETLSFARFNLRRGSDGGRQLSMRFVLPVMALAREHLYLFDRSPKS